MIKGVESCGMSEWITGMQDMSLGPNIMAGRRQQVRKDVEFSDRMSVSAAV